MKRWMGFESMKLVEMCGWCGWSSKSPKGCKAPGSGLGKLWVISVDGVYERVREEVDVPGIEGFEACGHLCGERGRQNLCGTCGQHQRLRRQYEESRLGRGRLQGWKRLGIVDSK